MNQELRIKNKECKLLIDTSDNKKVVVGLEMDGKRKELIQKTESWTSQVLLPMIEEILKLNHLTPKDLTGICVHTGPGSYTGLRVGVAVANTLGWLLGIAVNGKKDGLAEPVYG